MCLHYDILSLQDNQEKSIWRLEVNKNGGRSTPEGVGLLTMRYEAEGMETQNLNLLPCIDLEGRDSKGLQGV